MSKSKAEKIAESKAKHPAFQKMLGKQYAFDINTVVRYNLHTGMFSVSAEIDGVDTIYDEKFGGWRKATSDGEIKTNQHVIDTLAKVCVMLNQMVEAKQGETNE